VALAVAMSREGADQIKERLQPFLSLPFSPSFPPANNRGSRRIATRALSLFLRFVLYGTVVGLLRVDIPPLFFSLSATAKPCVFPAQENEVSIANPSPFSLLRGDAAQREKHERDLLLPYVPKCRGLWWSTCFFPPFPFFLTDVKVLQSHPMLHARHV